jgi:hypothetical protein
MEIVSQKGRESKKGSILSRDAYLGQKESSTAIAAERYIHYTIPIHHFDLHYRSIGSSISTAHDFTMLSMLNQSATGSIIAGY